MEYSYAERMEAIKRLKEKRDFRMHLGVYFIINALLVGIWAISGMQRFWPGYVMLFWGVGLALHGWYAYYGSSFSEAQIRDEMNRTR